MNLAQYKETRPERSVLFSLEPLGLGTAVVESLESYTCRLARLHGVARHTLEQIVNHHGEALYLDRSGPPRLDSPTELAANFSKRLAELTHRPEVIALGLGRFADCLATMHTLRKYRAWCGRCFHDARVRSVPAHLQLLWSFECYDRCTVHGHVLETQCRACGKRSSRSASWHQALDRCPWCDKDLADGGTGEPRCFAHLARRGSEHVDMLCGRVAAEFVSWASSSTCPVQPANMSKLVDSAIVRGLVANERELVKRAGLAPPTLCTLKSGRNRPSLTALVRLAAISNVAVAGLFDTKEWKEDATGSMSPSLGSLPRMRAHRGHDWDQIRREVAAGFERGDATPLWRLAKRFGVDAGQLATKVGNLRDAITDRARAARVDARQQKWVEVLGQVQRARESLLADGKKPTARAIGRFLRRPPRSLYFARAVKAVNALG